MTDKKKRKPANKSNVKANTSRKNNTQQNGSKMQRVKSRVLSTLWSFFWKGTIAAIFLVAIYIIYLDAKISRQFEGNKLVIASHNKGKVREIGELLAPFGVETISVGELNLPEPVEDGLTFIANAEIKAIMVSMYCAPSRIFENQLVPPSVKLPLRMFTG